MNPPLEALRKTRLLRSICPSELGGDEADPLTVMEVLEAVARIDGSAGWTLGILALTSAIAGAFLPVKTAQRIFAKGVPPMAGMIAPRGKAELVGGGYRACSPRWRGASPPNSGTPHTVPHGDRPRHRASRPGRDHRAGGREGPRLPTVAASYPPALPACTGKGRVAARIGACAGVPGSVERLDGSTRGAGSATADASGEARAAAVYITEVAQRVTTVAFQSAGGGALFDTNPLQPASVTFTPRGSTSW